MEKRIIWMAQTQKELRKMPEDVKDEIGTQQPYGQPNRITNMTAPKKRRASESTEIDGVEFKVGSGNVFADLDLPNARLRLVKAKLAAKINAIIDDYGWTQAEAAKKLDTHQPTISLLRKGRLKDISSERLLAWLGALHQDVLINVGPSKRRQPRLDVVAAR